MTTKKPKKKRPADAVGAAVAVGKAITGEVEEEPATRIIVEVTPEPEKK